MKRPVELISDLVLVADAVLELPHAVAQRLKVAARPGAWPQCEPQHQNDHRNGQHDDDYVGCIHGQRHYATPVTPPGQIGHIGYSR